MLMWDRHSHGGCRVGRHEGFLMLVALFGLVHGLVINGLKVG